VLSCRKSVKDHLTCQKGKSEGPQGAFANFSFDQPVYGFSLLELELPALPELLELPLPGLPVPELGVPAGLVLELGLLFVLVRVEEEPGWSVEGLVR